MILFSMADLSKGNGLKSVFLFFGGFVAQTYL